MFNLSPVPVPDLSGKVILVTGAGRGIGAELVENKNDDQLGVRIIGARGRIRRRRSRKRADDEEGEKPLEDRHTVLVSQGSAGVV